MASVKQKTVHLVAQGHVDLAWMWPQQDGYSEVLNTLHSVTALMEEYPQLCFSYSSAAYYEWVRQTSPALLAAIRKVASRGVYISPEILERMVGRMGPDHDPAPESELSDREMQVLVQLARGSATREVSTSLGLSMSTVETYRSRILQKLCLRNNSDITRFAIRRGLIEVG